MRSAALQRPRPRRQLSGATFDTRAKLAQRARAARGDDPGQFDYLRAEVLRRMVDRTADIARDFPAVLDLGAGPGGLRGHVGSMRGVRRLVQVEPSEELLYRDVDGRPRSVDADGVECELVPAGIDGERLPLESGQFDLVLSCMSAHWVNDLPGLFAEARRVLKPDGAFLCAMLGGNTLQELRSAFAVADQERSGGVAPHVSPLARLGDAGSLLSGAGFALPTVDHDTIVCRYPDMFTLTAHLHGMGEQNAGVSRAPAVSRDVFLGAAAAYDAMYADEDGLLPATFQVLHLVGWAPAGSQPKPKPRGSGKESLIDSLADK